MVAQDYVKCPVCQDGLVFESTAVNLIQKLKGGNIDAMITDTILWAIDNGVSITAADKKKNKKIKVILDADNLEVLINKYITFKEKEKI